MNKLLIYLYKKIKNTRIRKYIQLWISKRDQGDFYSITLRKIYFEVYGIQIGYGSYGGCFSNTNIPRGVIFGNYCSIAKNLKIFRANHPISSFTTHPILYNPLMGFVSEDKLNRPPLIIGNDVWIGANVIILPNVKIIGNGAVIGAGSVVTKDIEPYSIVAGNPAKFLKKRFSDSTIQKLENSKWWDLKINQLIKKIDDLNHMAS